MKKTSQGKTARLALFCVLVVFLIVSLVIHTLGVLSGLAGNNSLRVLGDETTSGARLLMFILVAAVSWLLGRAVYRLLVKADVSVGDSVNAVYVLILFLILTALTLLFFGTIAWFWFPLLFLMLLIFAIVTFWSLAGALGAFAAVVLALATIGVTWWLAS